MFRVGMKVVCVNDVPDKGHRLGILRGELRSGSIYTIRDFVASHYGRDEPCVRLMEIVRDHDWCGFRASRFRPVTERKTSIEIFQRMLTPNKETEHV